MMDERIHADQPHSRRIAVIGAGPAGIAAARAAAALGLQVDLFEKESQPGGKLVHYHQLFPNRESADHIFNDLYQEGLPSAIQTRFGRRITRLEGNHGLIRIVCDGHEDSFAGSVIVASGFDFFDARLKEEFGYGIYQHVITSPDLEAILKTDTGVLRRNGADPEAIAFVHCVGSRDQQVGIGYCSKLCCITGIKQAIEMKEMFPGCRVYNFYIDIRAYGKGYEELYREAQEKHGVQFIRGRVSEASEDSARRIRVKAEDTLMARPLKVTVDWLVLLVGMVPSCTEVHVDAEHDGPAGSGAFYKLRNSYSSTRTGAIPGVFAAGACAGPMSIPDAVASGRAAAVEAYEYLKTMEQGGYGHKR